MIRFNDEVALVAVLNDNKKVEVAIKVLVSISY